MKNYRFASDKMQNPRILLTLTAPLTIIQSTTYHYTEHLPLYRALETPNTKRRHKKLDIVGYRVKRIAVSWDQWIGEENQRYFQVERFI